MPVEYRRALQEMKATEVTIPLAAAGAYARCSSWPGLSRPSRQGTHSQCPPKRDAAIRAFHARLRRATAGHDGSRYGKVTGFLEIDRQDRRYRPASDRIRHFREFVIPLSQDATKDQAARCMNCGVPYCMGNGSLAPGTPGCPVNNQIPDFNDLVYRDNWQDRALQSALHQQFPRIHRTRVSGHRAKRPARST